MGGRASFTVNSASGLAPDDKDREFHCRAGDCSAGSSNNKVLQAALALAPRSASPITPSTISTISANPTTGTIFDIQTSTTTSAFPTASSNPNSHSAQTANQITAIIVLSLIILLGIFFSLHFCILKRNRRKGQVLHFKWFSIPRSGGVELPGSDAPYHTTELPRSIRAPVYEMAAEDVENHGISSQNAVMSGAAGEADLPGDSGKAGFGISIVTDPSDGVVSKNEISLNGGDTPELPALETTAMLQRGGSAEESPAKETTAMLPSISRAASRSREIGHDRPPEITPLTASKARESVQRMRETESSPLTGPFALSPPPVPPKTSMPKRQWVYR